MEQDAALTSGGYGPGTLLRPGMLLLDTCGSEATVALAEGDEVVDQVMLPGRSASEALIDVIGMVLRRGGVRLRDLKAVVVMRGPGSFTGVRVGLSTAKALAEGSGLPMLAVSRLEVLAAKAGCDGLAVLPAGRGEMFWARVVDGVSLEQGVALKAWVVEHARASGVPLMSEAGLLEDNEGLEVRVVPAVTAADALPLARKRWALREFDDSLLLDALYLHKTEQETLARQQKHRNTRAEGGAERL